MAILTIAEARDFAHDYESTDADMSEFVALAEIYIADGVGAVDPADPRARLLARLLVCDFDNNRSTTVSAKEAAARSRLVESLILQLKVAAASVSKLDTAAGG